MEKDNLEKYIFLELILKLNHNWKSHEKYENDETCAICLGSMKDNYVLELHCNHKYHLECIFIPVLDFNLRKCPDCCKLLDNN